MEKKTARANKYNYETARSAFKEAQAREGGWWWWWWSERESRLKATEMRGGKRKRRGKCANRREGSAINSNRELRGTRTGGKSRFLRPRDSDPPWRAEGGQESAGIVEGKRGV